MSDVRTLESVVFEMQWVAPYFGKLFSLYAFVALAIAALGVYGVTADSVAGRVRELGIRLAVGASPRGLVGMVVREGLALGAGGIVVGLVITLPLTGLLSATLFQVSARDPLVFAGVALLLGATTGLACYLPARRAARIDPMDTLRFE